MALIDKASLLMVPSTYEDGTLYNVLPTGNKAPDETGNNNGYDQTRADFTFSRGSNLAATRVNANGLIEKGRENHFLQSNNFGTTWSTSAASVTGGQADKDGGTDAWKLQDTAATSEHWIRQTPSQSGLVTLSVYAKANTLNFIWLRGVTSGSNVRAWFNLSSGTLGSTTSGVIDSAIEAVGTDGWYRCSMTLNHQSGFEYYIAISNADNTTSYAGDGAGSVFIMNSQLEIGLAATDYIETGSVSGTAGVLENTPRIDYSSGAGALLLESQRTNLITQSEYFGDSSWSLYFFGGASLTKTFGYTSPEGVDNAYKLDVVVGTGGVLFTQNFTATASVDHTLSVWMKGEVGGEKVQIDLKNTSSSGITGSLLTLTNQWKRYDLTLTNDAGTSRGFQFRMQQSSGVSDQTIYVWGAQAEASASYPSSYVPTYGSAATRGADYMNTTPTDLLGSTTGSWFMEMNDMTFEVTGTSVPTIYLGDDVSNCLALEGRNSGNNKSVFLVKEEGGTVTTLHAFTISGKTKFCFVWSGTTLKVFRDGTEEYSSTSFTQPTNWDLFVYNHTGREAFSEIANIQLYDTALSDSEAQTLTTL